ncbi:hypothetical protein acdb102_20520 [Acidothermaceae bacterium B102]|nr:hypothetical protein acdb102_20520 [Acidothermaceae bacterium B102]
MRRYAALVTACVTLALSLGTPALARAASSDCGTEIVDRAGALTSAQLDQLTEHAAALARTTELRIRTESSLQAGSLNADEEALQKSCGWADSANVRQPRLLVIMVATKARQMGIYPGTDLVGTITDPVWLSIEQQDMRPHFAGKDWLGGLEAGTDALSATLSGTAPPPVQADPPKTSKGLGVVGAIVTVGLIGLAVVALLASIRRSRRAKYAPNGDYIGPHHSLGAGYDRYGIPYGGGIGGGGAGGGGSGSGGGGGSSGF